MAAAGDLSLSGSLVNLLVAFWPKASDTRKAILGVLRAAACDLSHSDSHVNLVVAF